LISKPNLKAKSFEELGDAQGIREPNEPETGALRPGEGQSPGNAPVHGGAADPIELALTKALVHAAEAGRFDVVGQLAKELEVRRLGRASNVVALDPHRRQRGAP
jgi:hypothetical protein